MKVALSLIHNKNDARNNAARRVVQQLEHSLRSEGCEVAVMETFFQPAIHSVGQRLANDCRRRLHDIRFAWSKYLGNPLNGSYVDKEFSEAELKSLAIEIALSDKHITSWDRFLNSDSEILVSLEDDVLLKEESVDLFLTAFADVKSAQLPAYIDLGGGFPIADLGVHRLIKEVNSKFVHFSKPVTNTTCSYLVNRNMLELFKQILMFNPEMRYITPDWMINNLFIEIVAKVDATVCFHGLNSIFEHGTFSGAWPSSIR